MFYVRKFSLAVKAYFLLALEEELLANGLESEVCFTVAC